MWQCAKKKFREIDRQVFARGSRKLEVKEKFSYIFWKIAFLHFSRVVTIENFFRLWTTSIDCLMNRKEQSKWDNSFSCDSWYVWRKILPRHCWSIAIGMIKAKCMWAVKRKLVLVSNSSETCCRRLPLANERKWNLPTTLSAHILPAHPVYISLCLHCGRGMRGHYAEDMIILWNGTLCDAGTAAIHSAVETGGKTGSSPSQINRSRKWKVTRDSSTGKT